MPSDVIPLGTNVGPYRIIEQLPEGKGGMARVYVAVCERGESEQTKVALRVATVGDDPGEEKEPRMDLTSPSCISSLWIIWSSVFRFQK